MYTTLTESRQFKLYAAVALAALLMTLLAVTLTAGQAQATTTATLATDGEANNSIPQQQATPPPHATPEACPAEGEVASVVDDGHFALFDVWWNDGEGELTNTVCPPRVQYVPAGRGGTARTDRSASSINITAEPPTIIHIPSSAKVDMSTSTTYTKDKYPEVRDADKLEDRDTNGDGTPDGVGDGIVWVLPACPPDGPASNGLCLSFSAALLNPADWKANTSIVFHVDHVHQVDIDKQDPRYVVVYNVPEDGATRAGVPLWNSSDARRSEVPVAPGEYNRPMWFFTDRGTYEFQVHIQGTTNQDANPISKDESVTSDVREYIIHVGAEANLGVEIEMTPQSPSPDNDVSMVITASNSGPDTAPETKVDVTLPEGLTYSSHSPSALTFADRDGDGVWTWEIGGMASGASLPLTVTASVDEGTHGKALTAEAAISATETVKITETVKDAEGNDVEAVVTYHVPVPDPTPSNDMDTDTITVASSATVAPMFMVARSVPESSAAGTNVGAPVLVKHPWNGGTLTFTLSGNGHGNFTVEAVDGADVGAQIKVAANSYLNYEDTASPNNYDLTLQVSDGKDSNGNADNSVDDTIPVRIAVSDVSESVGLTATAAPVTQRANLDVELDASLGNNPPAPKSQMRFIWLQRPLNGEIDNDWRVEGNHSYSEILVTSDSAGVMQYVAIGKYLDQTARVYKTVESAWVDVRWTD